MLHFILFYTFSSFCLLSSTFIITTRNPIFSLLFLIFSFVNVACLLFLFQFEFIPISFMVIYVGAIAVLFLFVLMMLNIKLSRHVEFNNNILPIAFIVGIVFIFEILLVFRSELVTLFTYNKEASFFLSDFLISSLDSVDFLNIITLGNNLQTISQAMFSEYLFPFLISGLILLLAMVAAIILTIQKRFVSKSQDVYAQLLKDFNSTLVWYK